MFKRFTGQVLITFENENEYQRALSTKNMTYAGNRLIELVPFDDLVYKFFKLFKGGKWECSKLIHKNIL